MLSQSTAAPQSKKRKLEDGDAAINGGNALGWTDQSQRADHVAGDVSFSIPQRKKLRLEWVGSSAADLSKGGIRATGTGGDIEFGVGWRDIGTSFQEITSHITSWLTIKQIKS